MVFESINFVFRIIVMQKIASYVSGVVVVWLVLFCFVFLLIALKVCPVRKHCLTFSILNFKKKRLFGMILIFMLWKQSNSEGI